MELEGITKFLHIKVNKSSLLCAVQNQEGNFHRKKSKSKSNNSTFHLSESMLANAKAKAEQVAACLHTKYGIEWNYYQKTGV